MRVVTVHRGARDGYQVSRALQEAGLLEALVTDMYWPADLGWARSVESFSPSVAASALRSRYSDGLRSSAVKSCLTSGLASFMASKVPHLPFEWERGAIRWCDRELGRKAAQIASKQGAAMLSYSYYGHSAFSNIRGDQPRILFQLHPHPASVRTILQNERRLHPDCGSSLDKEWELALPAADFLRLNEEVNMAQHWIAASNFTKQTLVEAGIPGARIQVAPYGIDASAYLAKKDFRAPRDPLRLLFVGTLGQRKGIKYLLQALELLPAGSVTLTMCGRPVDDMSLLRESRIPVTIHPSISKQGLMEAYRQADVFVFPSLAEGFAHVLLEAMASGLPIVSTVRTAAPDLIEHGREGFIIQPGSASELALSIQQFLREPSLARTMGEAARRRAEYFSWTRFRHIIADFVHSVLTEAGQAPSSHLCLSR